MPQRMTAERVTTQEHDIQSQHEGADANTKPLASTAWLDKPHGFPDVVRQKTEQHDSQIKKVAMNILEDEGKGMLAQILLSGFDHSTGRGVSPERFVISASIVVASQAEQSRRPEDEKGWRK